MQTDDGFAMGNGSNRIMSLNGLRYPCVAMVAFTHFQLVEHCCPTDVDLSKWSVTFFLILSGFVLSIGYADKVLSRGFDYKKYWTEWDKQHPNESKEIDWGKPQGKEIW